MWKVVAYKELRETFWVAALALAAYGYVVGSCTGIPFIPEGFLGRLGYTTFPGIIPFVTDDFLNGFILVSMGFAVGMGMRQSAGESRHGTWLFLLHRPVGQTKLIAWKLTLGVMICLGVMGLPILAYAWWAATPGTHPGPFEWSMTESAWQVWFSMTAAYLGAFLVGMRPAKWFGSRLLPLVGVWLLASLMQVIPWWWILGVLAILLLDTWLVVSILYVARTRDY